MQNIVQGTTSDSQKSHEKQSAAPAPPAATNFHYETGKTNSSPTKSETETLSEHLMTTSEEDSVSEVLLAMNANVEDRGDCTGLMEAASAGHVDIVSLLIAHGADVNAQFTSGNTPLMYGCDGGHEEVVRILIEAGANVNDRNENGHTPLIITAREGNLDIAKHLIEKGANIQEVNDEGYTPLMMAAREGNLDIAIHLIEKGANIEEVNDASYTLLIEAMRKDHVNLNMLLIEPGANMEEVNDEDKNWRGYNGYRIVEQLPGDDVSMIEIRSVRAFLAVIGKK